MNKVIIALIVCLVIINILIFVYGRSRVKAIQKADGDKAYKAALKYIMISAATSFLTIVIITILAITKFLSK